MSAPQAFHHGELFAQQQAGMLDKMATIGPRIIRDFMPDQHREFFAQLPFMVLGAVDAQGQPWASIVTGAPGFAQSPDTHHLQLRDMHLAAADPLRGQLQPGRKLGLLGIEPHTRRRNRANGMVQATHEDGLDIVIEQSFGNCPKYIQARQPELRTTMPDEVVTETLVLTPAMQAMVRNADTFYIATALMPGDTRSGSQHGADVSHRGGKAGFVRLDGDATLTVPDFIGNSFFNTIGNLVVQPRAGLLFADFDSGALLYLAVRGEIIWKGAEVDALAGAQRLLRFTVTSARLVEHAMPLRWGEAVVSPFLEATGVWG